MKRTLYDCLENGLSEIERIKVEKHLGVCTGCQERLSQIKAILDSAGAKNIPAPKEEFWRSFKIGLDEKLNEALVEPFALKPIRKFYLKPAFAYAVFLIFFLAVVSALHKFPSSARLQFAQSDEELVVEVVELDELEPALELNGDEDVYLEEIDLFITLARA
jgi:hypothetical protein